MTIKEGHSLSSSGSTFQEGVVVRSTGSWYDVQTGSRILPCKIRGKFRLEGQDVTNPLAVGDRVTLRLNPDDTGLITERHERRNKLSRRAAGRRVGKEHIIVANVDRAWVVQSVLLPKINPGLIDRFLVTAEQFDIPPGILINKVDLLDESIEEPVRYFQELYEDLGYPVLMSSTRSEEGLAAFREALSGRTSVLAGPSGVGKTSLLNALEPQLALRTGAVSAKTQKGRHITTAAALYPLSEGGFVIDTPGIREFGIVDLAPEELSHYFVEFRPYLPECHFLNCTHDHEPGCAVQAAVEAGDVHAQRYLSYLNILTSLQMGKRDVGR